MLFDGDVERTIQSLDSCLEQTYEFKNISIALLTTKNLENLITTLGDRLSKIQLINRENLADKIQKSNGEFIQFVLAGDILDREKLWNCVELAHSAYNPDITLTGISNFESKNLPKIISLPVAGRSPVAVASALDIAKRILQVEGIFPSMLSRAFFRQRIFTNAPWLKIWIDSMNQSCIESISMFFFVNVAFGRGIHFLNEELVKRGAVDWSMGDLNYHLNISRQILAQIK